MFMLHDNTRRTICRGAILALCVLPTAVVLAWAVSVNRPGLQSEQLQRLSSTTGMRARAAEISQPTPGVTRLIDVRLTKTESDAPVFGARLIEAAEHDGQFVVKIAQAEAESRELSELWTLLARWFEDRLTLPEGKSLIIINDLTLQGGEAPRTFSRVEAHFDIAATGPEATIKFRLADETAKVPASIRVRRDRSAIPAVTRVEFSTGGGALPCSLLLAPLGRSNVLGGDSQFHGQLWLSNSTQGWTIESAAGRLTQVDLRSLVAEQFPHHLTGQADLQIDDARFANGRLDMMQGRLLAGPGQVGTSLIVAAQEWMQLQHQLPMNVASVLDYDQLAFSFLVEHEHLSISGACDVGAGTVLQTRLCGPVQQPAAPQPVLGLVRTLVPASQHAVPATREADWLTTYLPIPATITPKDEAPRGTRLRVGSVGQ